MPALFYSQHRQELVLFCFLSLKPVPEYNLHILWHLDITSWKKNQHFILSFVFIIMAARAHSLYGAHVAKISVQLQTGVS